MPVSLPIAPRQEAEGPLSKPPSVRNPLKKTSPDGSTVIDLRDVPTIDPALLAAIETVDKRIEHAKRDFELAHALEVMHRV